MPTYILLNTLVCDGALTVINNPERIKEVPAESSVRGGGGGDSPLQLRRLLVQVRAWTRLQGSQDRMILLMIGEGPVNRSAVTKDGRSWSLGVAADVAWIEDATVSGLTIVSAIPPVFSSYCTVTLPKMLEDRQQQGTAVVSLLQKFTTPQPWWLGYLDTGGSNVVFDDAPRVSLYASWPYVMVQAGPHEAVTWRPIDDPRMPWEGTWTPPGIPELMFPADRSWLVSKLWDDQWMCVGGPRSLIGGLLDDDVVGGSVRLVEVDEDSTPPGYHAF